eukprot:CAMPEP_0177717672 /NCGR_PEP_ID=MMETSP0484_2-20121128/15170_1 /TAXON_ID=354590 /ORGANISM="Rhodomonas lens, Strain RHODO" /LENGTH=163 /DNA_ID=CAMNT_0019229789 /DNA_START=382 /DNA_END=870 /DNA_ORIENTATION=-
MRWKPAMQTMRRANGAGGLPGILSVGTDGEGEAMATLEEASPINLRGAQAEIMKLDVASRRAIDIYVNEGLVEEDAVIDFSRRGHMSTILETALGTAQTDEEVDAVIAAGRTYLRNWHLGREGFRSRGEHEVACNVKTAEKLSRESIFFPEGGVDDGAEGEEG